MHLWWIYLNFISVRNIIYKYMLVPADEDEGAGGDVHYVTIEQDPDQSPEVCVSACADEGKPWFKH
jgi:hypothetical protein